MTSDPIERYLRRSARLDRRQRIRVMSSSEVTDTGLAALQAIGRRIIPASTLGLLFCSFGLTFLGRYVIPALSETTNPDRIEVQIVEFLGTLSLGLFVAVPLMMFGIAFIVPRATKLTAQWMLGEPLDDSDQAVGGPAFRDAAKVIFTIVARSSRFLLASFALLVASGLLSQVQSNLKLFVALIAVFALNAVGISLIAFVGIAAKYSLALPAMLVEKLDVKAALDRSRQLMASERKIQSGYISVWFQFGFFIILFGLLTFGFSAAVGYIASLLQLESFAQTRVYGPMLVEIVSQIGPYISLLLVVPAFATVTTVIYFERRTRLEGYDIAQLAQETRVTRRSRFDVTE